MDARTQTESADPAASLHSLHAGSLGGDGQSMEPAMALALTANFGSAERWRDAFRATGMASGGGTGWLSLAFQPRDGTLVNRWAADPAHVLAGGVPIVAFHLDEHASGAQVDAFMDGIHWGNAYQRYQTAVHDASEPIGATQDDVAGAELIDVRRAGVFEKASAMIPGARWRDPARVAEWSAELPADRALIVYCVYGHEVGRATAMRLRAAGLNVRYLRGGIDGWQAAGRPVATKRAST